MNRQGGFGRLSFYGAIMQESDWKYVYLEMPVSFELKREWNSKGYRVADIATMPEGYENPADEKPAKQQRGNKNA